MGEGAIISEAQGHPDRTNVDATGIWGESHASYPGRSAYLPLRRASRAERPDEGYEEVSRGCKAASHGSRRPNMRREWPGALEA